MLRDELKQQTAPIANAQRLGRNRARPTEMNALSNDGHGTVVAMTRAYHQDFPARSVVDPLR
jgi:hypothetical protein